MENGPVCRDSRMSQDTTKTLSLMIVAGEASGDAHAAALVRALRQAAPERQIDFFGSTGAQMRAAGAVLSPSPNSRSNRARGVVSIGSGVVGPRQDIVLV